MNKLFLTMVLIIAAGLIVSGCATAPNFSAVTGKEWKLTEVHIESTPFPREILFDRNELAQENKGNIFTLNFDGKTISGTGSPNTYSSPYTLGKDRAITIMPMRSTMMASLINPEKLLEHVYFQYMQNVYEWNFVELKLELRSKTEEGYEVRLVFAL